ncbi:MAG: hypothetical protein M3112_07140 [Actinomycetia bacterium]|nr:hypothetical protein [Actinomycetes bacterium]
MYRRAKYHPRKHGAVHIRADDWSIGNVTVLASRAERYIGIGPMADRSVLLLTRSVHTFSMKKPISIIVLDLAGTVVRAGVVHPRRIEWFHALRWVVETRNGVALPRPGTEVVASTIRGNARNTDPLRDTDRESWRSLRARRSDAVER